MNTDFYQMFSCYLFRGQGKGKKEGRGAGREEDNEDAWRSHIFINVLARQFKTSFRLELQTKGNKAPSAILFLM